jgi:hypothetical protein
LVTITDVRDQDLHRECEGGESEGRKAETPSPRTSQYEHQPEYSDSRSEVLLHKDERGRPGHHAFPATVEERLERECQQRNGQAHAVDVEVHRALDAVGHTERQADRDPEPPAQVTNPRPGQG